MAERIVIRDLQMEEQYLKFFLYLTSALYVRPHLLQHVYIDFTDGSDYSSSQLRQILWYRR
jgi:hypothetical protein